MSAPIEEIKQAVAENRTSDALSRLSALSWEMLSAYPRRFLQNNKGLYFCKAKPLAS